MDTAILIIVCLLAGAALYKIVRALANKKGDGSIRGGKGASPKR